MTNQNSKITNLKKGLLIIGLCLILGFGLFSAFQAKSQDLPKEITEEMEKREIFSCEPIPYGEFLNDTEKHLEKFLPLLAQMTKQSRQVFLSGKKLANLARERNSGNCGGQCGSLYGACYGGCIPVCETICIASCIITLDPNCKCMTDCIEDTCKDVCGNVPENCFVVSPGAVKACEKLFKDSYADCTDNCDDACADECPGPDCNTCMENCANDCQDDYFQDLQNCLTSFTGCHGNPFTPKTREVLPENIPKKEYEKALESAEEFQEALEEIRLLERELDQLHNASLRLEYAFGLWYRERQKTSLLDCYEFKDMNLPEGPSECPFNGNTYFHCK